MSKRVHLEDFNTIPDIPSVNGQYVHPDDPRYPELMALRAASPANSVSTLPLSDELDLIDLRNKEPRDVEWLIPTRLAVGMLTLLVGHGGVGKGITWMSWVASVSRGEFGSKRFCLISAPEDLFETMLIPRLMAAGADLNYVKSINALEFPADERKIENTLQRHDVALLVVDPVLTHLSGKTDSYRDHDVKRALTPLLQIAGRTGCAVLGVVHFTKNTEKGAFLSIQASGAFGNTARHVLGMVESPDADDERILSVSKTNISDKPSWKLSVQTKTIASLKNPVPYVLDVGLSDKSADEVLHGQRGSKANVSPQALQELVLAELSSPEVERTRDELNRLAQERLGASGDQLWRHGLTPLKEKGRIRVHQDGFHGGWKWSREQEAPNGSE